MLQQIKINDDNKFVKVAKYLMNYSEIKKATSIFDADFEIAVKKWQSNNKLTNDGIIGEKSWTALINNAPTCSTSKNNKSVYVCAIQILIGNLTVDGSFGQKTKKAVVAYQTASGLTADGVCGQKTWSMLVLGKVKNSTTNKIIQDCVYYSQGDSKWKKVMYSNHNNKNQTIGNSGCGPSSMAMILATWIDPKITPVEAAKMAVDGGYRSNSSGTTHGYFKYIFNKYDGFEKFLSTSNVNTMVAAIREGALAVVNVNNNDNNFWTKGGHYIVIRGVDDNHVYGNDPNHKPVPR